MEKKTHCKRGHEFTEKNTYVHAKSGTRSCRECRNAYQRDNKDKRSSPEQMRRWRKEWRKRNPHYHRDRERLMKLGATPEATAVMLEKQRGLCAICKQHMSKPQLDHNHTTNVVRELLCKNCNLAIGLLGEDTIVLKSAIKYLLKHRE